MDFAPGLVKVTLRPRPGYIPKVLSTSFRSQVATLHSFHPPPFASSEDERLHMLCPVRALKLYVDRSKVWRKSPQLLICFGFCVFVLRQGGPLRTPLSGFTTLTLIRLQVLRSCLFEPTVHCWFSIGPDRQRFPAWCVWYIVPEAFNAA